MLGLGLSVSKIAAGLRSLVVKLLSTLKSRATYYENNKDSKDTIQEIDNYEILDKASILLTPTATSDARVHSVKTYTGDELVTNGTFDADSNWTKGTGWSINGGTANCDGSTGNLIQNNLGSANKTYKLTFSILDYVSGYVRPSYVGLNMSSIDFSGNGTYSTYINSLSDLRFVFYGNSFNGSIDNVSVTEADADFDFDRASSATRINSDGLVQDMQSITDPELVLNGDFEELGNQIVNISSLSGDNWTADGSGGFTNNGSGEGLSGSLDVSTIVGETYKFTFDVTISGIANATFGGVTIPTFTTSGSKEYYVTATSSSTSFSFYLAASGSPSMFVNNISVQQVDPNDRWSLSGAATFEDGVLHFESETNEYSYARQDISSLSANTYEIQLEIKNYVSGACQVGFTGVSPIFKNLNVTADGTYTAYISPNANGDDLEISRKFSGGNFNFDVEVVSVKDITFSTEVDLARINYDSNGDNGHILLEPTSTNNYTYSNDFEQWQSSGSISINSNFATSPDGTQNASRLQWTNATNFIYQSLSHIGNDHTLSIYMKSNTASSQSVRLFMDSNAQGQDANVTTEWQRFTFSNSSATTQSNRNVGLIKSGTQVGDLDILIAFAQFEALPYATSYIPTLTGSTVTRATETLTGSGNSTLINSTEGVLYAEIADITNDNLSDNNIISISKSTDEDFRVHIALKTNGTIQGFIREGAANTKLDVSSTTVLPSTSFFKVAVLFESGNNKLYVNGLQIGSTDTSTFSNLQLNSLQFNRGDDDKIFYGKVKALAVFNEALSDDELELLTGVTNYGSFGALATADGYTII